MRIPGPSSCEPMNSIPADSNVSRMAFIFGNVLFGTVSTTSIRLIVLTLTPLRSASESTLQRRAVRADLICAPVIIDYLTHWLYMCHMARKMNFHISNHSWKTEFQRLEGAYAPSTMRSYYSDVQVFVDWCNRAQCTPFPASIETVCEFVEEQGKTMAASTVRRRLYAIRKIHRLLRLPDPTYDEEINLSLRRVRRSKLGRPKQAKGLTQNYLERFIAAEPDSPWGLRNKAMMSLGYELLSRRSELVALRTKYRVSFLPDISSESHQPGPEHNDGQMHD